MLTKKNLFITHPYGNLTPLDGFVKKSGRETLQNSSLQGSSYSLRAILCLSHPDSLQKLNSTEVFSFHE